MNTESGMNRGSLDEQPRVFICSACGNLRGNRLWKQEIKMKRSMSCLLVFVASGLIFAMLTGCDDDESSSEGHFCLESDVGMCWPFEGPECEQEAGEVVAECPTANLLGICTYTEGTETVKEYFYVGSDDAELDCTDDAGTWQAQ
jgi:hypothetical protein